MDDFRTEVDEHGNIKVTSYVEAVVLSKEEQEQATRIFKQLQEENAKLRKENAELRKLAREALGMTGNLLDDLSNLRKEFGIEP